MDNHYFQIVLAYLQKNPDMGIWFSFFVAFLESLPIIGTIIPGSITMTVIGILMGSGGLPLLPTLCVASIAAFIGDCIGYVLGFYYNDRIRTMWPFKKHLKWITMGETFFKKHGGKSIIIGRFFGPARSTVPLIAGILKLHWFRFIFAAIPSAFMWATLYLVPGVVLGALSRELPKQETTAFLIGGFATVIILFAIYWLIQHFFLQLSRGINKMTDNAWQFLMRKKSGKMILRVIANKQNSNDHHPLTILLFAVITGVLFLVLFFNVRHQGVLTHINYPIFHALQSIRISPLDHFFTVFTIIGLPISTAITGVLLSLCLWYVNQKRASVHMIIATLLAVGAAGFFKLLSHSVRPIGFINIASTSSFPSGHVAISLVVFFFTAYLFSHLLPKSLRIIPYWAAAFLVFMIGFSRIYLGAHWIDDVIGSALCGTTILLLCIISYRRIPSKMTKQHLPPYKGIAVLCIGILIPMLYFFPHNYMKTFTGSQPININKVISVESWWDHAEDVTPLYRNNRLGKPFQPLNVQWQGSLLAIKTILSNQGWQSVEIHPQLKTTLARFASNDAKYHMPFFPWLYHNQMPVLVMIKEIPLENRVIELHLWNSNIYFNHEINPLWIGTIDIRIPPKSLLSLKDQTKISLSNNGGLDDLYDDTDQCDHKYVDIKDQKIPSDVQTLNWNKKILLIRCE